MLKDLLNAIHFTAPLKELCVWLKNFVIPFSRSVVPDGQVRLTSELKLSFSHSKMILLSNLQTSECQELVPLSFKWILFPSIYI